MKGGEHDEKTKDGMNIYHNPTDVLTNNPPFPYHLLHIQDLGIVAVEQKPAEIWVYVPEGTMKLKIVHPQLGHITNAEKDGYYWFPEGRLKSGVVYKMDLITGVVRTIVEEPKIQTGWLLISSTPTGADVYLSQNGQDETLIGIDEIKRYSDDRLVIVTTGSQGESMAALSRMAADIHKKVSIKPGDTVIFSSNPIPGNEKAVTKVINELLMKGADVIFQDTHVSGHACQEEIKLIYALTKPQYAIPVHGEYRHLVKHAELCEVMGIPKDNIFIMSSGEVLELTQEEAVMNGTVPCGSLMVDGLGVGDVGNIVLRDRQTLAENGIIIVVLTLEKYSNQLLAGPDIVSRGFVYVRESEDLMEEAREKVLSALDRCENNGVTEWSMIKSAIRDSLGRFLYERTRRRPMILPIIMEI